MFLKLTIAIACILLFLTLGIIKKQTTSTWAERNSVKEIARRTKAEGRSKVTITGPAIDYPGEGMNLDLAARDYSVVVAEPTENKSYFMGSQAVRTWYRFRIVDTLSQKPPSPCYTCSPVPDIPEDFGAINPNEFLMATAGGTVSVDGIEVTVDNPAIPAFEKGKKYLLFISITPSQVALLAAGPSGVFRVNEDESLEAVNKSNRPLKSDINQRFNLKLSKLKEQLKP
jgi:hypothetical protein